MDGSRSRRPTCGSAIGNAARWTVGCSRLTPPAPSLGCGGIFGSRVVQPPPGQDRVDVGVLVGSVEVVVPDDARVSTNGTILFGSTDCDAACDGTAARPVTVSASGGFGSVDVVRQSERATRGDDRDDD